MKIRTVSLRLIFSIILLNASTLIAQPSTGSIAGEIRDNITQQPLPFTNILLEGTTIGAVTNDQGYFSIKNVPAGTYGLKATMIGYQTAVRSDVVVLPKRNTAVNIELVSSAIEVEEFR
jgi:hypothetical protein